MEENEQNKRFFDLCENLLIKPLKSSPKTENKAKNTTFSENYSMCGVNFKNRLCFFGLTDNGFCDRDGVPTDDFFEFYKKIAKSGVGLIVTGGAYAGTGLFKTKRKCNYSKLGYTTEENDIYSAFTRLIHTFGTKVFFKINTIFGRADDKNGVFCNFSRSSSKIRCYNNSFLPTVKLSDGACDKIIQEIAKMAMFASKNDFDGIVLNASLYGLMGEFSSYEINSRRFGYYNERIDFLKKILHKFKDAGIRKNLFIEFSFSTFCEEVFGKDFDKIKTIKNFGKSVRKSVVFDFIRELVKLGVDGFIFKLGTFETEFLSVFNEFECENLLKKFYHEIREFFEKEKILNKYGEKVTLIYHDNFKLLSGLPSCDNYLYDITKHLLSNENYLNELDSEKNIRRCIKCSVCDEVCRNENRVTCSINPSICYFEKDKAVTKENVAIIGAGVAGLVCATEMAKTGHKVTLFEASKTLNPHGRAMEIFGYNQSLKDFNDYLENTLNKLAESKKLNLHLGEFFDVGTTEFEKFDSIVVATGFSERYLKISGAILNNVKSIFEALSDDLCFENKKNIVIDAQSEISFELAMYLLLKGKFVSLIFSDLKNLKAISRDKLSYFLYSLKALGCRVYVQAKVKRIEADFVEILVNDKLASQNFVSDILNSKSKHFFKFEPKAKSIDCDLFVYEPETHPNCKVFYELAKTNYHGKLYMIGNALQNSDLENDIKTAFFVAKNI